MADKQKMENMKKSYVATPQDEWVIGNMKAVLDWAKKYNKAQYGNIKEAFNNYQNAHGMNGKVQAFEKLKASLVNKDGKNLTDVMNGWYEEYEPKIREVANQYTNGDMDLVPLKPETKQMKEIWDAIRPSLSSMPINEPQTSDLDVGDMYSDKYTPDQMAQLAAQYGYDYSDKNDRAEFLKLANDYIQSKDLEKIWNEPSLGNVVASVAYPVSKEYAKRNYNDIPTDNFWNFAGKMAPALATDVASQGAMAYGGNLANVSSVLPRTMAKYASKPLARKALGVGGNLVLAPSLTEVGQYALNDKPVGDAVQDALIGIGTNYAGPGAVFGTAERIANKAKYLPMEETERVLQDQIDKAVSKAAQTMKQARNGKQIKMNDGTYATITPEYKFIKTEYNPNKTHITEDELKQASEISAIGRGDVAYPGKWFGTVGRNKARKSLTDKIQTDIKNNPSHAKWSNKIEETINEKLGNRQPLSEEVISFMALNPNYSESWGNALGRWYRENAESPSSLLTNLLSSNRSFDQLGRNVSRLNGVYEYGQAKKKADDLTTEDINNDAEMALYAKSYANYLKNKGYYKEPKKPKDLSEDKAKKIRASIKSVYGL